MEQSPNEILERVGISTFNINYAKKVVHNISKKDMLKLIADWDDGSFIPVTIARDGWIYTTEEDFDYGALKAKCCCQR
jgi:hypothetical protein